MTERAHHDWNEIYQAVIENRPVNVEDAIIDVGTELRTGTIARDFTFKNCIVRGTLTFNFITLNESLSFIDTVFEDGVNFSGSSIRGQFVNQRVQFRNVGHFEGLSVLGDTYFEETVFSIRPNFDLTTWGPVTIFSRTRFEDGAQFLSANFNGLTSFINGCEAAGHAIDFTFATINAMFRASESNFQQPLLLSNVHIVGAAQITKTEFGPEAHIDLSKARIEGDLYIEDCTLSNTDTCVLLDSMQVSRCSIRAIKSNGAFYARNARFQYLAIRGFKTGTRNESDKSQFKGAFSLSGSRVGDHLICYDSILTGGARKDTEEKIADFTGLKIGDDMLILRCDFQQGAKFNRSQFSGIFGTDSRYRELVHYQGVRFRSAVRFLPGCAFEKGADFYSCNFDGEANFGGASIQIRLTLEDCQFHRSLLFAFPNLMTRFEPDAALFLEGSSYDRIKPNSAADLTNLISRIPNIPQEDSSLAFLEQSLRISALQEDADLIRYQRFKRRGERLKWRSKHWPKWTWNRFYWLCTRFGTVVWPVLLIAFVFGVATLFLAQLPRLDPGLRDIVKTVCAAVSAVAFGLGIEPVKRRLWPQ
jgi:hypothetical protein